jgi:hypothetical protein
MAKMVKKTSDINMKIWATLPFLRQRPKLGFGEVACSTHLKYEKKMKKFDLK